MSVSSIEPIIHDGSRNLNRTESFNDMVLEEAERRRRKDELVIIKRGAFIGCILIAVLCFISIYAITTLNHLQLSVKSLDDAYKVTKQKLNDNIKITDNIQQMCENANVIATLAKTKTHDKDLELEKLKVNTNTQLTMVNQKLDNLNNIKTQVRINALKNTNLENRFEQILLTGILRNSKNIENAVSPKMNLTVDTGNNVQLQSNFNNSNLILSLNNTLISRIDEIGMELQDFRDKIQQNSNQLQNLSTKLRARRVTSSFDTSLDMGPSIQRKNTRIVPEDMQGIIEDIKDSLNKLRFGRRCEYFYTTLV